MLRPCRVVWLDWVVATIRGAFVKYNVGGSSSSLTGYHDNDDSLRNCDMVGN